MSLSFGDRSRKNLQSVHPDLQRVLNRALSFCVMDFSIIEGHRSIERQQELFNAVPPKTTIDGINKRGKHNFMPSLAADILPYPATVNGVGVWDDRHRFCVLAGLMYSAASIENVKIRWGGDWDGDGNNADSSFDDLPHFELLGEK